jgi:hypothetical protein
MVPIMGGVTVSHGCGGAGHFVVDHGDRWAKRPGSGDHSGNGMARRVGKVEYPVRLIAEKLTIHVSVERLGTGHH